MERNESEIIVEELIQFDKSYAAGKPEISDEDYDEVRRYLSKIDPTNPYLASVGSSEDVTTSDKVTHEITMLSMKKTTGASHFDLEKWYTSNNIPLDTPMMVGPKMDGIACKLIYDEHGHLDIGATRGNGVIGNVIPFIGNYSIPSIPERIDMSGHSKGFEVVGELVIDKELGEKEYGKDSPLRNICGGIVSRKYSKNDDEYGNLTFIAFGSNEKGSDGEYLQLSPSRETQRLQDLENLGFSTTLPMSTIVTSIAELIDVYKLYLDGGRAGIRYQTDGLVAVVVERLLQLTVNSNRVVRGFNHYNIAIKPPALGEWTRILSIEWNVSKYGHVIPVAVLEPVTVGDVVISRATLESAGFIREKFGVILFGDRVLVKRANDVIPKIIEIDHCGKGAIPVPTHCPTCNSELIHTGHDAIGNFTHITCTNHECDSRRIGTIMHWIKTVEMKDVGKSFIQGAYKDGTITCIHDLYDINLESNLMKTGRYKIGGRQVPKVIRSINRTRTGLTDIDIITGVGIPNIGRTVLENNNLNNIDTLLEDVRNDDICHYEVCKAIDNWLSDGENYSRLRELKVILKSIVLEVVNDNNKPKVCVTGTFELPRRDILRLLKQKGYKLTSTVTANTEFLIVGDGGDTSTKYKDAIKLNGKVKITNITSIIG